MNGNELIDEMQVESERISVCKHIYKILEESMTNAMLRIPVDDGIVKSGTVSQQIIHEAMDDLRTRMAEHRARRDELGALQVGAPNGKPIPKQVKIPAQKPASPQAKVPAQKPSPPQVKTPGEKKEPQKQASVA